MVASMEDYIWRIACQIFFGRFLVAWPVGLPREVSIARNLRRMTFPVVVSGSTDTYLTSPGLR
jgi:hypothetical protein